MINIIQYMGFLAIGIVSSMLGPLLPTIQTELMLNYTQAGIILSARFLGKFPAIFLGALYMDKCGKRPFLILGGLIFAVALSLIAICNSYYSLLGAMLLLGMGMAILEIGFNALSAERAKDNGKAMNFLHLFFGAGAIIGPLMAIYFLNEVMWQAVFFVVALVPLMITVLLLKTSLKDIRKSTSKVLKSKNFLSARMFFVGIFFAVYVGFESSIYGWLPTYGQQIFNSEKIESSYLVLGFFMALTVGRLLMGMIIHKIDFYRYFYFVIGGVIAINALWAYNPSVLTTYFVALGQGFLLAGLFPTMFAKITANNIGQTAKFASYVTIFGSVGGFFIPSGIGKVITYFDISYMPIIFLMVSLMLFIITIILLFLLKKQNNKS